MSTPKYKVGDVLIDSSSTFFYIIKTVTNKHYHIVDKHNLLYVYNHNEFDNRYGYRKILPLEKILRGING